MLWAVISFHIWITPRGGFNYLHIQQTRMMHLGGEKLPSIQQERTWGVTPALNPWPISASICWAANFTSDHFAPIFFSSSESLTWAQALLSWLRLSLLKPASHPPAFPSAWPTPQSFLSDNSSAGQSSGQKGGLRGKAGFNQGWKWRECSRKPILMKGLIDQEPLIYLRPFGACFSLFLECSSTHSFFDAYPEGGHSWHPCSGHSATVYSSLL